jgi:O-antigen/teichoic acid export membrane protein
VSGLGLVVLTPVAAYNRFFVHLWMGRDAYAGEAVTLLACINALLWPVYAIWGWALLGTGHIRTWVPFGVLSTLVNIVVSVLGTVALGLVGPPLGTTAALLLVTSWALPRALHHALGVSPWELWRAVLFPLRWGLAFAVALWVVVTYHPPEGWPEFIALSVPGAAGGLVLWWRVTLGSGERLEWRARLRSVLSSR